MRIDDVKLGKLMWALAGSVGLGLAGCGGGGGETAGGGGGDGKVRGVIGATCLTTTNPFFQEIEAAMVEEAAKHGYEVKYLDGNFDVNRQQNQVKDFIVQGVAAIAINPCDSQGIGTAIKEANAAGIPVFTFDIACDAEGAEVVSHVATNNFQGGQLAGEAMIEALGDAGGKVVVLDFRAVESCQQRVLGFKDVIGKHNAGRASGKIEIVAELPGEGQKDRGFKATEDALQSTPDMAGIFAINDPSALGAIAALEKAGRAGTVKIVGFDGQLEGLQAIKDGKIYADPIQFPKKIGAETVKAIVAHLSGEEVEAEVLIPSALYRQADGEADPLLR